MKCFNCGAELERSDYCDHCGVDISRYRRLLQISNAYYNEGLDKAKVRDLSGAAVSLRQSLKINKKNTDARNLLGLVQFEMGDVVEALSQWILSKNFQKENNLADDYIESVQKNPARLQAVNMTIKKYNQSLLYCEQGSYDLAMIQLKKVLSTNSNLLKGHQLLALLYLHTGQKERAKKHLLYAAQIDVANTTTLRYLKEVSAPATAQKEAGQTGENELAIENTGDGMRLSTAGNYSEDKPNVMAWITLVVGTIMGVLVTFILIVPTAQKNIRAEFEKNQLDYSSELRIKEAAVTSLEKEAELWKGKYEEVSKQLSEVVIPEYDTGMYDDLFLAVQAYLAVAAKEEPTDAELIDLAGELVKLDIARMENADAKKLVEKMQGEIFGRAAEPAYALGRQAHDDGDYEQAAVYLQAACDYGLRSDSCYYYLGKSYQLMEANEQAAEYYRRLLAEFPSSSLASYTRTRLGEMGFEE